MWSTKSYLIGNKCRTRIIHIYCFLSDWVSGGNGTGSWCKGYASFRNVRALHQSPHWCCSWPCEILTFCLVVFISDIFLSGVILGCMTNWVLQPTCDTYYVDQRALITLFWDVQDPNVNNIVAATTFYSGTAATLCLVRSIHQQLYSPLVGLSSELVP